MELESLMARPRAQIVSFLETSQQSMDPEDYKALEAKVWLGYARRERMQRVLKVLLFLIEKAARSETAVYEEINSLLNLTAYNEVMVIIKIVGKLCRDNKWPPYAVLIKRKKEKVVGPGFFKDYQIGGSLEFLHALEPALDSLCFNSIAPDMEAMVSAISAERARQSGRTLIE